MASTSPPPASLSMRLALRRISNYYRFFPKTLANGPPPQGNFDIDLRNLRQEYLKAQQKAHPDVAGKASDQVDSATLGTAFRTLSDPLSRANHILQLKGLEPLSEGNSLDDEDLLMEILMIREEVAECEDPQEREKLLLKNDQRFEQTVAKVRVALEEGDFQAARAATIELSYWDKLKKTLEADVE